jgi:hypothetical protein
MPRVVLRPFYNKLFFYSKAQNLLSKFKIVFSIRYLSSYFSHYSFQITANEIIYLTT